MSDFAPVWIDTHTHLNDERFQGDLDAVIERAYEAGVTRLICCGYDEASSDRALAIARRYPTVWASVGLHPHDAADWSPTLAAHFDCLLREARANRIVAVGEVGMDFHYEKWEEVAARQELAFRAQIELAIHHDLPLIIHDRDAHLAVYDCLESYHSAGQLGPRPGVLHCYGGSADFYLQRAIHLGLDVGFDGPITYRNSRRAAEVVAAAPLERLHIETDCPWLPPEPHRGKRNEPAWLPFIARTMACIRKLSPVELSRQLEANGLALFWPGEPGAPN
ncbi:MAG: TatD family hydrolase [Bacillota bacterium]|nr:TatD family hydrolase [Bacillota bacterium]